MHFCRVPATTFRVCLTVHFFALIPAHYEDSEFSILTGQRGEVEKPRRGHDETVSFARFAHKT